MHRWPARGVGQVEERFEVGMQRHVGGRAGTVGSCMTIDAGKCSAGPRRA
jgi:hypothetical protein